MYYFLIASLPRLEIGEPAPFTVAEFDDILAENLPEKRDTVLPNLGAMKYTKNHVISLQNDRGTEYQAYLKVQNELDAAYNELRDELSKERFGTTFAELDEERQEEVKVIYDKKVSEAEPKNYGGK
jgi:hypothetical protein